jgi:hypothetical protein
MNTVANLPTSARVPRLSGHLILPRDPVALEEDLWERSWGRDAFPGYLRSRSERKRALTVLPGGFR